MSKITSTLLTVVLLAASAAAEPELILIPAQHSLHLGDSIKTQVGYRDSAHVRRIMTPYRLPFSSAMRALTCTPTNEGIFTIGPVKITIAGKTLKSDTVDVMVLPEPNQTNHFSIAVSHTNISLKGHVELVIRGINQRTVANPHVELSRPSGPRYVRDAHQDWQVKMKRSWTRPALPRSETPTGRLLITVDYMEVIHLRPKSSGRFVVDRLLFTNLPDGFELAPVTITVTKPANKPDGH